MKNEKEICESVKRFFHKLVDDESDVKLISCESKSDRELEAIIQIPAKVVVLPDKYPLSSELYGIEQEAEKILDLPVHTVSFLDSEVGLKDTQTVDFSVVFTIPTWVELEEQSFD